VCVWVRARAETRRGMKGVFGRSQEGQTGTVLLPGTIRTVKRA